jgi:hypothetical protein
MVSSSTNGPNDRLFGVGICRSMGKKTKIRLELDDT